MQADNENETLIDRDLQNLPVSSLIEDSLIEDSLIEAIPIEASPLIELSPTQGNEKTYKYTGSGEITAYIKVKVGGLKAQLFEGNILRDRNKYQVQESSPPLQWSSKDEDTFTLKVQNSTPNRTTLFRLNGSLWKESK